MDQQNMSQGSNPMGESKSGKKQIWPIIGGILLVMFIGAAVVFYLIFNTVKNAVQDEIDASMTDDGSDDRITGEAARDMQIGVMLDQYSVVVAATAEDVSWEEYLIELDAFIVELQALYDIDPDPLLNEGLDLFFKAKAEYEAAVKLDEPDAPVDEAGIATAGEYIDQAQTAVNDYLNEVGYE